MIKTHGKVIFSFLLLVAVCGIWTYLALLNAGPEISVAAPPPPVQLTVTELPKDEVKQEQEKKAEEPKAEPVKEVKTSKKVEAENKKAAQYKADINHIGAGVGGNDKGFPSFWCENPEDGRAFLTSLWKLGVKEFIVLSDGKIAGVVPFDRDRAYSFEKRHPQATSGFQRVLSGDDIALLGLPEILAKAGRDIHSVKAGFYLPQRIVMRSLAEYTRRRNIGERDVASFTCKYTESEGFTIIDVQKHSNLAALPQ